MVKRRGSLWLALGLGLVAGLALWKGLGSAPPAAATGSLVHSTTAAEELPRINLARLEGQRPEARVGRRDLFDFGSAPVPVAKQAPTPPPLTPAAAPPPGLTQAPPPNLKYIGSVENRKGLKVAVLLTEGREILTGQTGEVVANRFRIVQIGLESVEIQDVASAAIRRIPLRGN